MNILLAFRRGLLSLCLLGTIPAGWGQSVPHGPMPAPGTKVGLFPAPQAQGVNPDTPFILTFAGPVTPGRGRIEVRDAADQALVATVDLAAPTAVKDIGGLPNFHYYPVLLEGARAIVTLRNHALQYGHSYAISVPAGAFQVAGQPDPGMPAGAWTFATKAAAPGADAARLVVAADGTGDFNTLQAALDFIPEGNRRPITIFVRRGTYREIVFFADKHNLTIAGEDRRETVLAYPNNARLNADSGGNPFAPSAPHPSEASPRRGGGIYRRGLFLALRADDLTVTQLTLRNTTPPGGSQAEAIILNGTTSARAILKDVDLFSFQDTLQINGQAYVEQCLIEGDVDFMWGTGPCFFEGCTLRALRSAAFYTQIRNPASNHGFVYDRCRFTGLPGVMGNFLSRVAPARFPASEVVLVDCELGPAVGDVAWQLQATPGMAAPTIAGLHFWEFNSRPHGGGTVVGTFRLPGSRFLGPGEDAATAASYRQASFVLGGWEPRQAPVFADKTAAPAATAGAIEPAAVLALVGTPVRLAVPGPTDGAGPFRWRKNGEILPGEHGPELRLAAADWGDAAVYSAELATAAGPRRWEGGRLTVVAPQAATPPQLPHLAGRMFSVLANGARGDGTTDNAAAVQRTIDAAAAAGGGCVVIPAAAQAYLSGPLLLASGVELHVAAGAILRALPYAAPPGRASYPRGPRRYPDFISAADAHDIALTGSGTIDGDGEAWWQAFRADKQMLHRPYLIRFSQCERVLVAGLTFTRSPMFHLALSALDQLTVVGVTIATPDGPNTDGIDPSGSHQLFQNCVIATGDDNLVLKPGGAFCRDITVADCFFGAGHGLSVGGQTNRGLDGMTVKNCHFEGTTSGLRLKADPTQGGPVRNITYTGLVMHDVEYPIVFYSYYNQVGNPGGTGGRNEISPEKAGAWNASPPNALTSATLPSWQEITVQDLWAVGTTGYNIIWGLPLPGYLFEHIRLDRVHFADGPGFALYNVADVQFTGDSQLRPLRVANTLAVIQPPADQAVAPGTDVTWRAGEVAAGDSPVEYEWRHDDTPLRNGPGVTGADQPTLGLHAVSPVAAGHYSLTVKSLLSAYDPRRRTLAPRTLPVALTTAPATLTVAAPPP